MSTYEKLPGVSSPSLVCAPLFLLAMAAAGFAQPPEPRGVGVAIPSDPRAGAVDVNIKPSHAQVFVNGFYSGVIDDFDGFPRYLWLREGGYELAFYLQGYETMVHRVVVSRRKTLRLAGEMVPGKATRPTVPPWPSTQGADADAGALDQPELAPEELAPEESEERAAVEVDEGSAARLRLDVWPADAAVYLDGTFLGVGEELRALHAPLRLEAGQHEIEVVHPRYRTKKQQLTAAAGEELELVVELEP
jgi:hypothetical protein